MTVVVAVAYWRDGGVYPRASARRRHGDVYLRSTAVMAATWHRVSSLADTTLRLCTNVAPTGHEAEQLARQQVTTADVDFTCVPPAGYFDRFSAATYTLDVLSHHAGTLGPDDVLVVVDPDVVWVRDPAAVVARARAHGIVGHAIPYPPDVRDLGLTRRELGALITEMSGHRAAPLPAHIGGELLAVTGDQLPALAETCRQAWDASVARFHAGQRPLLHTEEHVLSYAFEVLDRGVHDTPDLIRRVWTRPGTVRNVTGDEDRLVAWHVLTEKGHGLPRLFDDLRRQRGAFATDADDDTYRRRLARRLAIEPTPAARAGLVAGTWARRALGRRVAPMSG